MMCIESTTDRNPLKNEEGFTLLEIIAVLVIMSILAVVAVPKYFNLQTEARRRAFETGKAEVVGRVNGYFAEQVLQGVHPNYIDYTTETLEGNNMGDFSFTVDNNGLGTNSTTEKPPENFNVTISGKDDTEMATYKDVIFPVRRPGL